MYDDLMENVKHDNNYGNENSDDEDSDSETDTDSDESQIDVGDLEDKKPPKRKYTKRNKK